MAAQGEGAEAREDPGHLLTATSASVADTGSTTAGGDDADGTERGDSDKKTVKVVACDRCKKRKRRCSGGQVRGTGARTFCCCRERRTLG